jgi:hypothetical protein
MDKKSPLCCAEAISLAATGCGRCVAQIAVISSGGSNE